MLKEDRQQKILNLIRAKRIGTQDELTVELERAGYPATQSSVSRDLVELGILKLNGHYTVPQPAAGAAQFGLLDLDTA
ncbi:MAG: hypothetical protein ABIZ95_02275, partial [Pyrinomonadaceae bacterium]